jgi:hypothetical protein
VQPNPSPVSIKTFQEREMTDTRQPSAQLNPLISPYSNFYDVIIVGGGSAGVCAAVQAGRAGARTLLVEKTGMLGGTATNAGVNFPGLFHAWGKQVIAGIGWELVIKSIKESGISLPDFSDPHAPHWKNQVVVDRGIFAALCDELVLASGAEILFHTMPASAEWVKGTWQLTLCTKAGLKQLQAHVLVDCSADANLCSLAGCEIITYPETQPATLVCHASGYDPARLDLDSINSRFTEAVQQGQLKSTDAVWDTRQFEVGSWLLKHGENAGHITAQNAHTSEGKTKLEIDARAALLRLYRFLKQQPGLETLCIDYTAPECGVRETCVINGQKTISVEDYATGAAWDDAVCYSFYPIDLHTIDGTGLIFKTLPEKTYPSIPRGAMLPKGSRNLIAAGRCISSDRLANSALRVQASCMAMGQAAGAMAALASSTTTGIDALPITIIKQLLKKHGAVVPGDLG